MIIQLNAFMRKIFIFLPLGMLLGLVVGFYPYQTLNFIYYILPLIAMITVMIGAIVISALPMNGDYYQ